MRAASSAVDKSGGRGDSDGREYRHPSIPVARERPDTHEALIGLDNEADRRAVAQAEAAADIPYAPVDDVGANAICVSGRTRRATRKAAFGSVTRDVILGSDRPVLAVPAPVEESGTDRGGGTAWRRVRPWFGRS